MAAEDLILPGLWIRFLLPDGRVIGPTRFSILTRVIELKQYTIDNWPRANDEDGPRTMGDLRLLFAGHERHNHLQRLDSFNYLLVEDVNTMHVFPRFPFGP